MAIGSGDSQGLMGCKDQTVHSNKYNFPHLYWKCYVIVIQNYKFWLIHFEQFRS